MKIAYIGIKGLPSKGGAERVVEALAKRTAGVGHEVTVYCSKAYTPPDARIEGLHLFRIPTLRGKHLHMLSMNLLSSLHAISKGDYNLIHLHNVEAAFVIPLLRLRYPVLSTSHGPAYLREKWGFLSKALLKFMEFPFSYFSTLCTSVSSTWGEYYSRTFKKKLRFIPNGVDDQDLRVDRFYETGEYVSFAAGRILPSKGCHLLLHAAKKLNLAAPIVVIGDLQEMPDYSDHLRKMAPENTSFVPFIPDKKELFQILSHSRLFVFPSTVEAMSMMLLEVAALGVPMIVSDIPENSATIPADCALFFRSGDTTDLAAKLRWAFDNGEEMAGMARKAEEWIVKHHDWDAITQQYLEVYKELVQERKR